MSSGIESTRWIRIITPYHIPKYLIEQIKHRKWSVDEYIAFQEGLCLLDSGAINPLSHLYVLADTNHIVKGFLWFVIDPLAKAIHINTYSVDKELWGNGKAVHKLKDHIVKIRDAAKLDKILWATRHPKHSMKYGFRQSPYTLMEYTGEEDGIIDDIREDPSEGCGHNIEGTEGLSK